MHSLDVYHLPGRKPEVIMSRAPATVLACACTRMRTSTGSSLGSQTAWAVTAGAPVTSTSVGGGRAEFVLHGEEAQTNSSANSDLRVFEAWMSWLHGSQPPDPLAFIRRARVPNRIHDTFPRVSSSSWCDAKGRDSFVSRVPRAPLGCVHACGVARARHSRVSPRKGPLRRIPGRFRDESC